MLCLWFSKNSSSLNFSDKGQSQIDIALCIFSITSERVQSEYLYNTVDALGPVTPSCFHKACSRRCKIPWIAVGTQKKTKKCTSLFEIFTSKDVAPFWKRPRSLYRVSAACNCVSIEFKFGDWLRSHWYPLSARDVFTARQRCPLRADCMHKTFFFYW